MRPEYLDEKRWRRFLDKIDVPEDWDDCWLWTGTLKPNGYGAFMFRKDGRNRTLYAHRIAYEGARGPIPRGLHIDHVCFNRACVNPAHLEAVTQAENNLRSFKGMCAKGLHPMEGHNIRNGTSGRRCRACFNAWRRENRAKKRAAADYLERAREAA